MMSANFGTHPVSDALGIEVDFDPTKPLDEGGQRRLRNLFNKHHLLVFTKRAMAREDQRRLVGYLGPVLASDRTAIVSNVEANGVLGDVELGYHSDLAFTSEPYLGLSLYGLDVDDGESATRFANAARAYERLPGDLRQRVEGLQALNVYSYDPVGIDHTAEVDPSIPQAIHPVVSRHPVTGTPVLYVTEQQTHHIVGLTTPESDEILDAIFESMYAPDNVYEHWWKRDDLVIWDNIAVQHARRAVDQGMRRTLRREIIGKHDLTELVPDFKPSLT